MFSGPLQLVENRIKVTGEEGEGDVRMQKQKKQMYTQCSWGMHKICTVSDRQEIHHNTCYLRFARAWPFVRPSAHALVRIQTFATLANIHHFRVFG